MARCPSRTDVLRWGWWEGGQRVVLLGPGERGVSGGMGSRAVILVPTVTQDKTELRRYQGRIRWARVPRVGCPPPSPHDTNTAVAVTPPRTTDRWHRAARVTVVGRSEGGGGTATVRKNVATWQFHGRVQVYLPGPHAIDRHRTSLYTVPCLSAARRRNENKKIRGNGAGSDDGDSAAVTSSRNLPKKLNRPLLL